MEPSISKAQLEVWEWKERAWESVQHLPTMKEKVAAIRENIKDTIALLKEMQRKHQSKTQ